MRIKLTGDTQFVGGDGSRLDPVPAELSLSLTEQLTDLIAVGRLETVDTITLLEDALCRQLMIWSPTLETAIKNAEALLPAMLSSLKENWPKRDLIIAELGITREMHS